MNILSCENCFSLTKMGNHLEEGGSTGNFEVSQHVSKQ